MRGKFTAFFTLLLMSLPGLLMAQKVTGTIQGTDGPLIGASVTVGPGQGTITDIDGKYTIDLAPGTYTLTASYVGYTNKSEQVSLSSGETKTWNVTLAEDADMLADVIIVGSRGVARSSTDTPVPVDVVSSKELQETGQYTFDKALQFKVPSFNTVQTPVNDATSLLDPYEIRNMGPSRTLILVNGKRKNSSALVYTQTSPGRGETGADISAIPVDAIKRVEILRDGASAQYGSDAIAGVMNIILKDNAEDGYVTLRSGITHKGDGEMFGVSVNNGANLFDKGFINYTIDLSKVGLANRPGTVDAQGEFMDFQYIDPEDPENYTDGATRESIIALNTQNFKAVQDFLAIKPDAGNVNGSPETTAAKFLVNSGINISEEAEFYFNAAYVYKKVNSFANYRTPYWRDTDFGLLTPAGQQFLGYVPTFDGDLNDYNGTIGFRTKVNGWNTDVSFTTGGNQQLYTVTNSVNRSMGKASPVTFRPGGYNFSHNVGNLDISRLITDKLSMAFGSEFRSENFQIIEGDEASYEGGGADSFAGNSKENSLKANRYNFGGYFDLGYDITNDFLINGTIRLEDYSDFGSAFVWKASTRYKLLNDKITIRSSYSTGFRAPSMHQIYVQKAQYSFVAGKGIQVEGLVNNVSPQAKLLDLKLDPEKSTNFTVGLGINPTKNTSITLDYYNIRVDDRIVLSNNINGGSNPDSFLNQILQENGIVSLNFFANSLDTRTSGIDVVASYGNIALGRGILGFNLAGNYTIKNERIGAVRNPKLIEDYNNSVPAAERQSVINYTQEALMFTSRPLYKAILGTDFEIGKFSINLGNTLFGPTKFRNDGLDEFLQIEFKPKVVTDLGIGFQANENINFTFFVNNIFNVLPEWEMVALNEEVKGRILNNPAAVKEQSNLITFNQRYPTLTYDGSHFSQLGTMFNAALTVKF